MNAIKILTFPKFPKTPFQFSLPSSQSHFLRSTIPLPPIRSTTNDGETQQPPSVTPPDTVEIRFRRGSRRRRQKETDEEPGKKKIVKKNWEEMNLSEKAVELYMGEKGFLFWVNKFAYASIFIVIGGWILFRFVGPSLNLYQLDTPPLAPDSMFKGS